VLALLGVGALAALFTFLTSGSNVAVLNPAGTIAGQQKNLIILTTVLGLFVVIPVFILLFGIAWKYREGNVKARYTPNVGGSRKLEALWWGIPAVIILVLSVVTWQSSHALDPFKEIEGDKNTMVVEVVSLQWKWLFIYPELGIASVNYLPFPEKTPMHFQITSDAPMNSFWIPNLGGQVYAMSGMSTELHLQADQPGSYRGVSANISGAGFASMNFTAQSMTEADFDAWVQTAATSKNLLDSASYKALAQPSTADVPKVFRLMDNHLYDNIMMKYVMPDMGSGMKM
jgi:cytochrome o ubiquinol oxidase subunit 2